MEKYILSDFDCSLNYSKFTLLSTTLMQQTRPSLNTTTAILRSHSNIYEMYIEIFGIKILF